MSSDFLLQISSDLGISYWWILFLFVVIVIWSAVWKMMALWKSARKGSLGWFIVLAIVNTVGILEILYIYVFSKTKTKKVSRKAKSKKRR